jgi:peptidoglycan/LPS O-acetylase OafA/YrhL
VNAVPSTLDARSGTTQLLPAMRTLLGAFAVLTALATVALFVLATTTADTFAWTIQPPLTAAFLGAGYAAGFLLVVLSLRRRTWSDVRVPVLTIFVFVVLTLVATLIHINKLHFDDDFGGLAGWRRARRGSGSRCTSSSRWRCSC